MAAKLPNLWACLKALVQTSPHTALTSLSLLLTACSSCLPLLPAPPACYPPLSLRSWANSSRLATDDCTETMQHAAGRGWTAGGGRCWSVQRDMWNFWSSAAVLCMPRIEALRHWGCSYSNRFVVTAQLWGISMPLCLSVCVFMYLCVCVCVRKTTNWYNWIG